MSSPDPSPHTFRARTSSSVDRHTTPVPPTCAAPLPPRAVAIPATWVAWAECVAVERPLEHGGWSYASGGWVRNVARLAGAMVGRSGWSAIPVSTMAILTSADPWETSQAAWALTWLRWVWAAARGSLGASAVVNRAGWKAFRTPRPRALLVSAAPGPTVR